MRRRSTDLPRIRMFSDYGGTYLWDDEGGTDPVTLGLAQRLGAELDGRFQVGLSL